MAKAKRKKVEYQRHPASEAWGDMNEGEYQALVESMKRDGFHDDQAVLVTGENEDQVVDGWHRLQAANDVGVDPQFESLPSDFTDKEIAQLVISRHAARRNLTKAQIAERIVATMRACGQEFAKAGRPTDEEKAELEKAITAEGVADAAQVSKATARRAIDAVKDAEETDPEAIKKRAERKAKSARKQYESNQADTLDHYKELAETMADRVQELELIVSKADLGDREAEWNRAVANNKQRIATLTGQNKKLRQRAQDAEAEAAHYKAYAAEMEAALAKQGGGA